MASEIRVNKINSRTGVGTITLSPTGVDFTGIATVATLKATTGIVTTLSATGDVDIADKIVHTGDTNTAIRFPAADTFTVETGGSERVRVDSSGRMGLGSASPEDPLHIKSNSGSIRLENTVVSNNDSTISYDNDTFEIKVDPNNVRGSSSLKVDIDDTNAITIDDNRRIGIGTESPSSLLHLNADATALRITRGSSIGFLYNAGASATSQTRLQAESGPLELYTNSAQPIKVVVNGTEEARFLSGGGLTFNGDTAAANALDDYEEGTWTPTVTSAGSVTGEDAKYTKVGNLVHVYGKLTSFTDRSSSNTIVISSLPYTASTNQAGGSMFARYADRTAFTVYVYSNKIEFYSIGSGAFPALQHSQLNNSNAVIYFQATYNVA